MTRRTLVKASRKLRQRHRIPAYQLKMEPPHLNLGWTTEKPLEPERKRKRLKPNARLNHPLTPSEPRRAKGSGDDEDLLAVIKSLRAEVASLREEVRQIGSHQSSRASEHSGSDSLSVSPYPRRRGSGGMTPTTPCANCARNASTCAEQVATSPEPMDVDASRETEQAAPPTNEVGAPRSPDGGAGDPEPGGDAAGDAGNDDVGGGHDYHQLLEEFEEWIHMKTRMMKRDQAFIKMLPGLMQRWLRSKKIEGTPQVFVDGLTRACIDCVMPNETELRLTRLMGTPDTRVAIERLNKAIGGEVTVFEEADVEKWVWDQMWTFPVWWFTWWFGYLPSTHVKLWVPNMSFLGLFSAMWWMWPQIAPAFGLWDDLCFDVPLPNIQWRYGSLPWWEGTLADHAGTMFVVHTFCMMQLAQIAARIMLYYCWISNFLRGYYRFMYYWSDWVPKGMWRDPFGGVRCFGSGNGKSQ